MISNLPEDLETEILARVPSKSLGKLQTTCKRWYLLFKDPNFIKENSSKSAREMILLMSFGVYSLSLNYHGIRNGINPSIESRGKLRTIEDYKELEIYETFQCNGLILCVRRYYTTTRTDYYNTIDVWNPCTGETRWVKPRSCYHSRDRYALGYRNINSSCHTYKILRFISHYNERRVQDAKFEIYEFSSDSWRIHVSFSDDWDVISHSVSLKGNTYWIDLDKEKGFSCSILISRQRDLDVSLFHIKFLFAMEITRLCQLLKRISVLYHNFSTHPRMMKIWVTNKFVDTKDMSWSNFFVVDLGKYMLPVATVRSFLLDEENKVAVCCAYDQKAQKTKIYIVGERIYTNKFIKRLQGTYCGIGHFLSVMFQGWFKFGKIHSRAKENESKEG